MLYAFLYLRYFNISLIICNNHVTGACTRHVPWIPIRQPGKRHFTREEKGIETIATVTVLKNEWPDSLGADIYNEISKVQNFYCYVINPRRTCAARVTVVVLCVCLSVCQFVCQRLFSHYRLRGGL